MTDNMERLNDFQEFQGGKVTFGGGKGRITGKGTIRTPTLDFENVYYENPYSDAEDEGIFDSGCSRSMTDNMERLNDFQEFQGGIVTFGGGEGRITGKGTIRTPTLDFENVYYVKELQRFNLFSISQICDKKNRVLFIDTDCLVLSKDFLLPDKIPGAFDGPSWRLYTLSNVHVLETISGEVLYMFADVSYPLSVKLMERMLKHKLEIDKDVVGNDMTTAEQLIRFIKNQIAAAQVSPV
ncbi:hypothetical protein Tco_0093221 [Tanacetum coccineum]